jgi:hypothetical protein
MLANHLEGDSGRRSSFGIDISFSYAYHLFCFPFSFSLIIDAAYGYLLVTEHPSHRFHL